MLAGRAISILAASAILATSCFRLTAGTGGLTDFDPPRRVDPADVAVPEGYRIELVATGLTFPTGVAFDGRGRPHVIQAGYAYGEVFTEPQLLRIDPGGRHVVVARGENPPWTGVTFHDGAFYVAEGGVLGDARIVRIDPGGAIAPVVTGLPPGLDHHTNGPAIGPDGKLYFGVGVATNSGVVGVDNFRYGWLPRFPDGHDLACEPIVLRGVDHVTPNPLTPDEDDEAVTGAFVPFGTPTEPGQVIPASHPCRGAVYRVAPEGGEIELVAWGLRNPYGFAFSPAGELYVTENGHDVRGSRPVFGASDHLWRIEAGRWYGFPDFSGGLPLFEEGTFREWFTPPGEDAPERLLAEFPGEPPRAAAYFGVHSSSNGLDFSRSARFGHEGDAFVAQFGDMAPVVGEVINPVGFRVVRVDVDTGVIHGFAANRGETGGPATYLGTEGLERPVDVQFDPSGESLYVVDFGVYTKDGNGSRPWPGTGVLWRIVRTGTGP